MLSVGSKQVIGKFFTNPKLSNKGSKLELEAKYGWVGGKGFVSSVSYSHFTRLMNNLKKSNLVESVAEEVSTVIQDGPIRRISTAGQEPTVMFEKKERLGDDVLLKEYDIRISASAETEITEAFSFGDLQQKTTRERSRTSFYMTDGTSKIDMTEVVMTTPRTKDAETRHEVEVEHLGDADTLGNFERMLEYVFRNLKGTNLVYTKEEKASLESEVGQSLGVESINREILVEARNIKRGDLVYGGIVGCRELADPSVNASGASGQKRHGTRYAITFKADGVRKLLITNNVGIWLVYPPFEYNLVLRWGTGDTPVQEKLGLTILDGELVESEIVAYRYLAFDCLVLKGDARIQRLGYETRMRVFSGITKIVSGISPDLISTETKDTQIITAPEEFFEDVYTFLKRREKLDYKEDGIMFIPTDVIYNPHSEKHKKRVLTKVPDICKWKDSKDITIDFSIRRLKDGKLELHVYKNARETAAFKGNKMNELTPDMIDYENDLTKNATTGSVFEYEWDYANKKLVPRKYRPDKRGPNRMSVALDNWGDIMNPITAEEISGKNLAMSFSYHKRIKGELYSLLSSVGSRSSLKILDIGSGMGGDVLKWVSIVKQRRDSVIIAVEPNEKNRKELYRRLDVEGLSENVLVLPVGGEDTKAITENIRRNIAGGKVDVVSLMLSMSFFWQSEDHLDALVATIASNLKVGGRIIFLTINGDLLEKIFREKTGGKEGQHLKLLSADIFLHPEENKTYQREDGSLGKYGRKVDFTLPGTIVGEQTEYLVHIKDFSRRLEKYGIFLDYIENATNEKLLSQENLIYTSMYSYGEYIRDSEGEDPSEKKTNPLPPEPKKSTREGKQLAGIPVIYQNHGITIDGPAINDDTYSTLKCSWYTTKKLVRIATIGDGSCFVHSVLKACYEPYQSSSSAKDRIELVSKARRDFAALLSQKDQKYENVTHWATAAGGSFPRLLMQELASLDFLVDTRIDYSLKGMQRLFNSDFYLGEEAYQYISDTLDIDITVLQATPENLYFNFTTRNIAKPRRCVVVVGNGAHFEVMAVVTEGGLFQTVFDDGDDIIREIDSLRKEGIVDLNPDAFDPDASFVEEFVEAFHTKQGVPGNIKEILPKGEPFLEMMDRLSDQISARFDANI